MREHSSCLGAEVGVERPTLGWYRSARLPRTGLLPDTPHRVRLAQARTVTHVRLDVFPDGGISRLRLRLQGTLTEAGLAVIRRRWDETAG